MIAWLQETIINLTKMGYAVIAADDFSNQPADVVIATSTEQEILKQETFSLMDK